MTKAATTDGPSPAPPEPTEHIEPSEPSEHIGPSENRPVLSSRRRALGAAAVGLLAAACRSAGEEDAIGSPLSTSTTGGGEAPSAFAGQASAPLEVQLGGAAVAEVPALPPTATGPELEQVMLPVVDESGASLVTPSGANPAGTNPGSAPMVVVTDPGSSTTSTTDMGPVDPDETSTSTSQTTAPPTTTSTATTGGGGGVAKPGGDGTTAPFRPPIPVSASPLLMANRIGFGADAAVVAQLQANGAGGYLADQLAKTGADPQAEALLSGFPLLEGGRSRAAWQRVKNAKGQALRFELTHSTILRAVYSRHQLFEMMCQLWADHFNVDLYADGANRHLLADHQENVIRPNAMGTFRDLLVATAHSPAMLTYLDNDTSNAKRGINENYGRELLELHTLGIDDAGNQVYSEADVRTAAMAMTGWSRVSDRKAADFSAFLYRANYHHTGDVSLLGGAWTSGSTTGKATGDSLLQFLATHPSTARHVARKLCRRFVADNPPADLVASAAQVYLDNDTALVPTLRHILTSEAFAASAGSKLRRPLEQMAAAMRALGTETATAPGGDAAKQLRYLLEGLDHLPWSWPQPDGFPDTAGHWLSTDGLVGRWQLAARLARSNVKGTSSDLDKLRNSVGGATVGEVIAGMASRFGLGTPPADQIAAVAQAARLEPGAAASSADEAQLGDIAALLLSHPLFQTR